MARGCISHGVQAVAHGLNATMCHNYAAHFIVEQKNPSQVAWSRTTYGFVINAMLTYKKWGAPIQQLPTIQQVIQCGC